MFGCVQFSHPVSSDIQDYSRTINEFNISSTTRVPVYDGSYTGITKLSNIEYKQYVFPKALKSEDSRMLMILVPIITERELATAQLYETTVGQEAKASAKLIIRCGGGNNPNNFLNKNAPFINKHDKHTIIIQKPFPSVEFDNLFFTREISQSNLISWRKIPLKVSIDWHVRKTGDVIKKRMKYLYTIPLDIITSPIQLLGWLMLLPLGLWE